MMSRIARSLNSNQSLVDVVAQTAPAASVRLPNPRSFSWRGFYFAYFYGAYLRQMDDTHAFG